MNNRTLYLSGALATLCVIFCAQTYASCESSTPESLEGSSPMESSGPESTTSEEASSVSSDVLAPVVEPEAEVQPPPTSSSPLENPLLEEPPLGEGSMTPVLEVETPSSDELISVPLESWLYI